MKIRKNLIFNYFDQLHEGGKGIVTDPWYGDCWCGTDRSGDGMDIG